MIIGHDQYFEGGGGASKRVSEREASCPGPFSNEAPGR